LAGPDVLASRLRPRRAEAAGPAGHLWSPACPPVGARGCACPGVTSHCADQPGRAVPDSIVLLGVSPDHRSRQWGNRQRITWRYRMPGGAQCEPQWWTTTARCNGGKQLVHRSLTPRALLRGQLVSPAERPRGTGTPGTG